MMVLFKSLVLSRLKYCYTLAVFFKMDEIADLENVQKTFTAHKHSFNHLNYWEYLNSHTCILYGTGEKVTL